LNLQSELRERVGGPADDGFETLDEGEQLLAEPGEVEPHRASHQEDEDEGSPVLAGRASHHAGKPGG